MPRFTSTILLIVTVLALIPAFAQQNATIRDVVNVDAQEAELLEQAAAIGLDSMDMSTPLRSIVNLGQAYDEGDLERIVQFMDLRYLPEEIDATDGPELGRQLAFVWSRNNILDLTTLSDEPEGHTDENLPSYRDRLGTIQASDGPVHIYLQRVPGEGGTQVWKISNATIAEIPGLWEEFGYGEFTRKVAEFLPDIPPVLDLENWQMFYLLLILILSWPVSVLLSKVLYRLITVVSEGYPEAWPKLMGWPARVFLYFLILRYLLGEIALPLRARVVFEHGVGPYIAWTCLLIGVIEFYMTYQSRELRLANRSHAIPLIRPFGLIAKCLLIIVMALLWAENAGYDMTTVIAGLGVGSVAIALAAKNTIENLIGAITIYVARPISPGDFCRFGNVRGIVEEIGLRATMIRTLDRTLVYIPNCIFSADEIENYSSRDRIRYFRDLRIRLDTSPDQVRFILVELRRLFCAHPKVYEDLVSIRFDRVTEDAINLRTDAHIKTQNFQEYLMVAEDLNLLILDTLKSSGTWFALPARRISTEESEGRDEDRVKEIEKIVSAWNKEDRLMFPDYSQREGE